VLLKKAKLSVFTWQCKNRVLLWK